MVIGRRKGLIAAATVAAAVLLAVAISGRGCSDSDSSPEGAVRAFVAAARAEDKHALWDTLGPRTRGQAEAAARAATEKVGGARRYAALDMLDVSLPATSYAPSQIIVREQHDKTATVDLLGPEGHHDSINVVEVDGRWKVELSF